MDPIYWGVIGFAVLLILLGLGVPVAISMVSIGTIGLFILIGVKSTFNLISLQFFSYICTFEFGAIPLFLLMGYIAYHTGLTGAAFSSARLWLSRLPGGLAIATTAACGLFGACCGSGIPAVAAMGRIALPEMLRHKYEKHLVAGVIASSGTLAVLIPPSIPMVIYAIFAEESIGKLFLAGYLPGVLSIILFAVMIIIRVRLNPNLAPPITEVVTWRQRLGSLKESWGIGLLIFLVMGSLYSGFFNATEASALGALGAFILMAVTKTYQWKKIWDGFSETLLVGGMIFLILVAAITYSRFIGLTGLPKAVANWIIAKNVSVYAIILLFCFMLTFLGCFMDAISMLLLTMPVFLPILKALDVNLIWFGIIYIKLVEIGCITPPFGITIFVLAGVAGDILPIGTIFRGIFWFLLMEFFTLAIIIIFPEISLFLPNIVRGSP